MALDKERFAILDLRGKKALRELNIQDEDKDVKRFNVSFRILDKRKIFQENVLCQKPTPDDGLNIAD